MDLMDDAAWDFSDPSLESLEISSNNAATNAHDNSSSVKDTDDNQSTVSAVVQRSASSPLTIPKKQSPVLAPPPDISSTNENEEPSLSIISSPPKPTVMTSASFMPSTGSTLSSSVSKSAPADPHTTIHDVESLPVANSSSSSINEAVSDLAQIPATPSTPTTNAGFFNNMMTSLSFNKQRSTPVGDESVDTNVSTPTTISASAALENATSPNMLSYRRSKKSKKRNTSTSSIDLPQSPLTEVEKPYLAISEDDSFDTNLYVDEKFASTNYRYATVPRNEEFHKLFKSVPVEERLLDDFSCALSRDILLQGRLYVSEHNLCFNSNLLGWVTNLVIPYSSVKNFEKTVTAGLFPNGIAVDTTDRRHSFASFISRDLVYQYLEDVWKASGDQVDHDVLNKDMNKSFLDLNGAPIISKSLALDVDDDDDDEYNSVLLSIDGDSPSKRDDTSRISSEDDDDDEEDEDGVESDTSQSVGAIETKFSNQTVFKLKSDSKFKYDGISAHGITKSQYDPETNKETVLAKENVKCPPGLLFEILFGSNTEFVMEFLQTQDGRDFSSISDYEDNDDGLKERHYEYIKGLSHPMGPKSTKCIVKETIEHNEEGYINIVNTTQTPDVPSGSSFLVKTRYIMTWGPNNTTDLIVSFWVQWIGSSWMKGVIDKSCKTGQEGATRAILDLITKYVKDNVVEETEEVSIQERSDGVVEENAVVAQKPVTGSTEASSAILEKPASGFGYLIEGIPIFNAIVMIFLAIIFMLQVWILCNLHSIPAKTFSLGAIDTIDKYKSDTLFKGEEVLLWNWIDERTGSLDISKKDKSQIVQKEIDQLISRWATGELNTKEGEKLIKNFQNTLNQYADVILAHSEKDDSKTQRANALKAAIDALV